ncbi:Fpg/Nei family DNA glycosylase [Gordonia amarae]|uniref:DNA-(apurinic or apyrimidinic site) lyase n=2 Tax=Gordonia amarae TaxID=36821 RepID=G7GMY1_9ACTN|nr:zinc finger domain-containing protein [Gordonia amarae]MCS3878582.1 endonuclease-8 [Gordonia amarae]QHN17181.1 Fpg/Nei family DNA glycosylase [Gordonia amarae]QHN21707.1 Fpg/Nei family DNA glycosylase [Gordonia amarae]QHN30559.1 Fpg/Nei family DNA glycosylase [Gordonia amarae]QHN39335.1 Fpg/Nei family DNA glycosylase [Gordonia amarae]
MPEGHTLHRLAGRQRKLLGGKTVAVTSPQGRFAEGAAVVDGMVFHTAEAWGKHLIQRYRPFAGARRSGERLIHIHLGLYGAFSEQTAPMAPPVGQVRLRIEATDVGVDLRGPSACQLYTPADLDALVARLGPDPLRRDARPERAFAAIARSTRPIGALLMDQKVMAGVGNVYRAEVLFRAGIDPYRQGTRISHDDFEALWADLVTLMRVGVRKGRIHVVRPADDHGAPSYAADRPRTYVYRRAGEDCRICGTTVAHAVLDGRNLFWCPACQR